MDHFVATVVVIVAAVLHLKYIYLCIFCKARILPVLYTVPCNVVGAVWCPCNRSCCCCCCLYWFNARSNAVVVAVHVALCESWRHNFYFMPHTHSHTHLATLLHTHTHTYSAALPVRYKAKDIAHTPRCSFMSTSVRLAVPLSSCRHHKSFEVA